MVLFCYCTCAHTWWRIYFYILLLFFWIFHFSQLLHMYACYSCTDICLLSIFVDAIHVLSHSVHFSTELSKDGYIFQFLFFEVIACFCISQSRSSFLKPHFLAHILFKGWCTWDQVLDFDGTLACRATCWPNCRGHGVRHWIFRATAQTNCFTCTKNKQKKIIKIMLK